MQWSRSSIFLLTILIAGRASAASYPQNSIRVHRLSDSRLKPSLRHIVSRPIERNDVQLPSAQTWWGGFGKTGVGGSYSAVYAILPYNGGLVVGGDFASAGNTRAANIAFWNGVDWEPMGEGVPSGVFDLAMYNGKVIAAGGTAEEWDGTQWRLLGGGTNDWVMALEVYGDKLIAGGFFTMAGAESVGYIAQWDGTDWQPLGDGFNDWVTDLTVYGDKLAAAGYFGHQCCVTGFAEWDGSIWTDLPTLGEISFLQGSGDSLFAGTYYASLNGDPFAPRVAVWNGTTMHAMGPALDFTPFALKLLGDELFVGGNYRIDEFSGNYRLAMLDGNAWVSQITDAVGSISALQELQGHLVIGGGFATVEGELMNGISRKEYYAWQSFGPGAGMTNYVAVLGEVSGNLVAGGKFSFAGQTRVNGIAQWDGTTWHAFGSGMNLPVFSLTNFSNKLIAGGLFTQAGGVVALHVAQWDGMTWSSIGAGFDNSAWALEVFDGSLYAGGTFTKSGTSGMMGIARWDGQNWSALPPLANPMSVGALLSYRTNTELIVGGGFTNAAMSINNIARWNGGWWSALGAGLDGYVQDLCEYQGDVIACGGFTKSGTTTVNRIARWDGTSWHPIGPGFASGSLADVEVVQGVLVAAGYIRRPDESWVSYAAYWDGHAWQSLGELEGSEVRTMHSFGSGLFMGGDFESVGGVPSYYIARLDGILDVVPVQSLYFEANRHEGKVVLAWDVTGSLEELAAFRLDRRVGDAEPTYLAVVANGGGRHFDYVDENPPLEKAEYRLWGIDRSGGATWLGSALLLPALETSPRLTLLQSSPNPCRGAAVITLRLCEGTRANLRIIDSAGREVIQLLWGLVQAGQTSLSWNGQDRFGHPVPSGIYYYQLDTPFERVSRRLVVVK
jgi:hypothetical protein